MPCRVSHISHYSEIDHDIIPSKIKGFSAVDAGALLEPASSQNLQDNCADIWNKYTNTLRAGKAHRAQPMLQVDVSFSSAQPFVITYEILRAWYLPPAPCDGEVSCAVVHFNIRTSLRISRLITRV